MVDINKAVIARMRIDGNNFEILVDCDKAVAFRGGKGDIENVLAAEMIFKDAKKGERAPEHDLKKSFKTDNVFEVASAIIKKGELQLTAEYRNKLREEKRKRIIELIHRNSINPQNNLPHPGDRIARALDEAKVHIDEFKKAEEQVQDVITKLRPILPIKFEVREISVKVPAQYAAKCYNILKNFGTLKRDDWQNDGSLLAVIELPAGLQEEFENELNKLTKGEIETKILSKR